MILKINDSAFCMAENTPFVFDEAQKSADAIRLIKNGDIEMEISRISDFSVYSLEGGEWTSPPQSLEQRITAEESRTAYIGMMTGVL